MKEPKKTVNIVPKSSKKKIGLSERETEVLALLLKGFTNKSIAEQLFISSFTVKRHTENIYRKLQVHNRMELFQKAQKKRLA